MDFPLFDLTGRTALVTGSSRGIGEVMAKGLAAYGAAVVIHGIEGAATEAVAQRLIDEGHRAHVTVFDVTDAAAVSEAVTAIERDVAPIDILINNAGIQYRAPLEDFPADKWQALFDVNVTGTFHVSQAVARGMIARGAGKIINIGSVQSELARPTIAPYTATKGAIRNLTRGMAADWARHGLQINAIAPGYFRTDLNAALVADPDFTAWLEKRTPAGRWGEVGELIGAAVFLASSASSFVNGQTLYVDGGLTASV